jgi:crotonobetainyl-CoA:carnitine CoA-transferase CaiB-like acyl-CoA transferase
MTDAPTPPGPLAPLRVLELADATGQFCGKLMGDLGADVIKIEPVGGEAARRVGPFLDDTPHPERSLFFPPAFTAGPSRGPGARKPLQLYRTPS